LLPDFSSFEIIPPEAPVVVVPIIGLATKVHFPLQVFELPFEAALERGVATGAVGVEIGSHW
jgi:hypothetical protein